MIRPHSHVLLCYLCVIYSTSLPITTDLVSFWDKSCTSDSHLTDEFHEQSLTVSKAYVKISAYMTSTSIVIDHSFTNTYSAFALFSTKILEAAFQCYIDNPSEYLLAQKAVRNFGLRWTEVIAKLTDWTSIYSKSRDVQGAAYQIRSLTKILKAQMHAKLIIDHVEARLHCKHMRIVKDHWEANLDYQKWHAFLKGVRKCMKKRRALLQTFYGEPAYFAQYDLAKIYISEYMNVLTEFSHAMSQHVRIEVTIPEDRQVAEKLLIEVSVAMDEQRHPLPPPPRTGPSAPDAPTAPDGLDAPLDPPATPPPGDKCAAVTLAGWSAKKRDSDECESAISAAGRATTWRYFLVLVVSMAAAGVGLAAHVFFWDDDISRLVILVVVGVVQVGWFVLYSLKIGPAIVSKAVNNGNSETAPK